MSILSPDFPVLPASAQDSSSASEVAPAGVLELRLESGYVAKFTVIWHEPTQLAGNTILLPKTWSQDKARLGYYHTLYLPPGATNVVLIAEAYEFIGMTKTFYSKQFEETPNECIKFYGTIGRPAVGPCASSDFTAALKKATAIAKRNADTFKVVSEHLAGRPGSIDDAVKAMGQGHHDKAAQDLDLASLGNKLSANTQSAGVQVDVDWFGEVEATPQESILEGPQSLTLTLNGGVAGLIGGSYGTGAAFSVAPNNGTSTKPTTLITSWNFLVCCGLQSGGGLTLGMWRAQPSELSGVAHAISVSAGSGTVGGGVTGKLGDRILISSGDAERAGDRREAFSKRMSTLSPDFRKTRLNDHYRSRYGSLHRRIRPSHSS